MDHVLLVLTLYNPSLSWNHLASSWDQRLAHVQEMWNQDLESAKYHLVSLRKSG